MDENRKRALAAALTQIERQFGKGSVMLLGENKIYDEIDRMEKTEAEELLSSCANCRQSFDDCQEHYDWKYTAESLLETVRKEASGGDAEAVRGVLREAILEKLPDETAGELIDLLQYDDVRL